MARRVPEIDFLRREVSISGRPERYALAGVKEGLIPSLALVGLKEVLLRAKNTDEGYAGLVDGTLPIYRQSATAKRDPWLEAMAVACAEQIAAAEAGPKAKASHIAPLIAARMDEMRAHVAGLSREVRREMKSHPAVQQHHRAITGVRPDQLSLLAIAGVTPPAYALPTPEVALEAAD